MFEESYLFTMSEKEENTTRYWIEEHNKTCKFKRKNIPRSFTFSFTPLGIGTDIEVGCSCGEAMNVTDINAW